MTGKLLHIMSVNPHQFKAFSYVVREGSITGAARQLGVSQSAVSQHIAKLEATVGMRLFLRGRDGIELTATGQEIYEFADRYVTLENVISEKLQGYSDMEAGNLRIIANAPQPALGLIARFADLFPKVHLDFSLRDWTSSMELLQKQQVDLAVVTDATPRSDWLSIPISKASFVVYAPASHHLVRKPLMSLKDFATETLLLPEAGSLTQRVVTAALRDHAVQPRRMVKTTTFPVMKEAILAGLGIGIFLEGSANPDSDLVEIPIEELVSLHQISLVIPKHKVDLRLIRSFVEMLNELKDSDAGNALAHSPKSFG